MKHLIKCGALLLMTLFLQDPSAAAQEKRKDEDPFARIGNLEQGNRLHLLERKLPAVLPDVDLPPMDSRKSAFTPLDRMDTSEELQIELAKLRKKYLPFMADHAPPMQGGTQAARPGRV